MPTVSRWLVRTSLAWLLLGLGLGALGFLLRPAPAAPAVFHLLVVGWLSQLIFGVAHWLFPRAPAGPARGREALLWAAWGLLNAGLLLRLPAETAAAQGQAPGILLLTAGLLQFSGATCFVVNTWPRLASR